MEVIYTDLASIFSLFPMMPWMLSGCLLACSVCTVSDSVDRWHSQKSEAYRSNRFISGSSRFSNVARCNRSHSGARFFVETCASYQRGSPMSACCPLLPHLQ